MALEGEKWVENLLKGLAKAEVETKIGLLYMYRPGCDICEDIFEEIDESKEFEGLAKDFVLMKIQESGETDEYHIDGKYTPRVLFVGTDGSILDRYYNETLNLPDAKYYYCSSNQLTDTMKRVFSEQMDPSRHDCAASDCSEGWRSNLTPMACGYAIMALFPPIFLLIFSNKLY